MWAITLLVWLQGQHSQVYSYACLQIQSSLQEKHLILSLCRQGEEKGHSSQRQGCQHGPGSSSRLTNSIFPTLLEHVRWRASRKEYTIGPLSLSKCHIPVFHSTCRKPHTLALPNREYHVLYMKEKALWLRTDNAIKWKCILNLNYLTLSLN